MEDNYCIFKKFDMHVTSVATSLSNVVAIASEHGFRSIVTIPRHLKSLREALTEQNCDIMATSLVDYPFGCAILDSRMYSIRSSIESGADEVEITAPYPVIVNNDINEVMKEIVMIQEVVKDSKTKIKYVFDWASNDFGLDMTEEIFKTLEICKIDGLSNPNWFTSGSMSLKEEIKKLKFVRKFYSGDVKIYLDPVPIKNISVYFSEGITLCGVEWKISPNKLYEFIEKNNSNTN